MGIDDFVFFLIWSVSVKGCRICGVFTLEKLHPKIFSAVPSGETVYWMGEKLERWENDMDLLYPHDEYGGALHAAGGGGEKVRSFMFFCLFVTLLNGEPFGH